MFSIQVDVDLRGKKRTKISRMLKREKKGGESRKGVLEEIRSGLGGGGKTLRSQHAGLTSKPGRRCPKGTQEGGGA